MSMFRLSSVFFLAVFFIFPMHKTFAHGGGHKPEENKIEAPAATDSMYSVKEIEKDSLSDSSDSLDNMFSPTDLFTQDELVDPMPMDDKKMEGSHNEHARPQVELSHHERVSSSSKGFGTAIGITLFAGLAFAGLTFRRPGE
jgi:hypothetical protein